MTFPDHQSSEDRHCKSKTGLLVSCYHREDQSRYGSVYVSFFLPRSRCDSRNAPRVRAHGAVIDKVVCNRPSLRSPVRLCSLSYADVSRHPRPSRSSQGPHAAHNPYRLYITRSDDDLEISVFGPIASLIRLGMRVLGQAGLLVRSPWFQSPWSQSPRSIYCSSEMSVMKLKQYRSVAP